jgi:very-short-patch-repair endonuclease
LDKQQQELAKIEVQHEVTKRRPSLDLEHASSAEQVLVRREAEKQRKHKPLRELFDQAGSFITQLTPCFMMSPLSVAQHLKADSIQFDTVIFDEASQIMPQDAVSSLIRADQAIIAGDTKQLPPTSFFQSDVETTEDVREDLDSILKEAASVLSEKTLQWHYRSRTEELIQFSNYQYYNNSLRTFPENDPDVETGVSFEYVEDGVYDRGGSRQNEIEAQRVIDIIEEHAEERSDKSLGVVAFSSAQEQAIRDALAERREESPVLDAFVSQDDVLDEFFIKNLEMVQGDERDRMIFSVGYGPAQDGTVRANFGPLNKSGGERRLNVAVTRAREHVTVVCSMLPGDIDLSGSNSTGAKHFKDYLEYARKGEQALVRERQVTDTLDFDSQFEEAVYDALEAEGYDVVSQVQSSGYSIDLAIKHPEQPGKFILGIECDGAAYHSSKTARDRDRTRQMVLEDLGWTIHRIWSPDWASNEEQQLKEIDKKVKSLLEEEPTRSDMEEIPSDELIRGLQELYDSLNRLPLSTDMRNEGSYQPNDYYDEFGDWDSALAAAGIDKEALLIEELRRVDNLVDGRVTTTNMQDLGTYSSGLYSSYFDGWTAAIEAAGITEGPEDSTSPDRPSSGEQPQRTEVDNQNNQDSESANNTVPSKSTVLKKLQELDEEAEIIIKPKHVNKKADFSIPDVRNHFQSWDAAIDAAGIDKESALIAEFKRVANKLGKPPSSTEMNNHGRVSSTMYHNHFGSFAGVRDRVLSDEISESTKNKSPKKEEYDISQGELISDLERIRRIFHRDPSKGEYREHGNYDINTVEDMFESWSAFLDARPNKKND